MNNDLQNYFEILCNDSPNPCTLIDPDTYEIIFMNYSMLKLLKESSAYGVKEEELLECYKKINSKTNPRDFVSKGEFSLYKFEESYILNEKLNKHFRAHNTLIQFEDKQYNFCKYFVASSYSNQILSFEEAMTKSVEILSTENDFDEMTGAFLALLGEFYESTKAYVFYLNSDKTDISSYYEWVLSASVKISTDIKNKFPIDKLLSWIETRDNHGIVEISHLDADLGDLACQILDIFEVQDITLCAIEDKEGQCIGVVGMSNKVLKVFDHRLLKTITRFIQDGFSKTGMQEELKALGEIDFLTGFYSRSRYALKLRDFENNPPKRLGVVFVNINGLRKTNEYMGFAKGDEQIANTAEMLTAFFSEQFYRISGDEFVCFCLDDEEDFLAKVYRVHAHVKVLGELPFALGHAYKEGYDIVAPKLVAEADTVMYINKQEYYHTSHQENTTDTDDILTDLLTAIANEEFIVYLQPQIDLTTEKVIGAEALIRRYDNEKQKMIYPDQFIPMYEQRSIIRHIDIFVVDKICQILTEWRKKHPLVPISVNLSRVTLIEFDIVSTLANICDNYDIPHEYICIEVTERVGVIENDVATNLIDEFKERGFRISLDDFGCAYSNIVTLANITVDEVKIDKSLVDNLIDSEKNRIIVDSMISMCNKFKNTHTLAEGIETKEQATILSSFGCTYGQGYYYSRPLTCEDFFAKYVKF